MSIELTAWGHAGLRLERDGQRLAIDPGSFTDGRVLDGVTAVLVTHEHVDHVVPEQLGPLVAEREELSVWAPQPVVDALVAAGAPAARVHPVTPGQDLAAAGFAVQVLGGEHAVIHPAMPPVVNAAYLVDGLVLHPGDSFTPPPAGVAVEVLALPVAAPWLKLSEAVDYAALVAPDRVVPVHDAILNEAGVGLADRVVSGLIGAVGYRRLQVGEPHEVG